MTTIGKILVFLNLVGAVAAGAFIGLVYLTRTNWKTAYDQLNARVTAYESHAKSQIKSEGDRVESHKKEVAAALAAADEAKKQLDAIKVKLDDTTTQLQSTKKTNDEQAENVKGMTAEVERRKAEVAQVNLTLKDRDERIRALEKSQTEIRNQAVEFQLKYKTLRERYDLILAQNEEMSKEIAKIRALGIDTSATTRRPPADQVRGTVKSVDGNLATVSVGTDAGVNKDNILYIYRLTPQPQYLGKLSILAATPHEAVGRFEPMNRQVIIKAGDEASSKITVQK